MPSALKTYWLLCIGFLSFTFLGCTSSLQWVKEPHSTSPSCIPDRLPVLDDFSEKSWEQYLQEDRARSFGGQIRMKYLVNIEPPYLVVRIDPTESWISPDITNPDNFVPQYKINKVLVHAQIHYMIHCMLIREGNKELQSGGNPRAMLDLVRPVAERVSSQYDQNTEYGLNEKAEANWELAIRQQFENKTLQGIKKIIEIQKLQP